MDHPYPFPQHLSHPISASAQCIVLCTLNAGMSIDCNGCGTSTCGCNWCFSGTGPKPSLTNTNPPTYAPCSCSAFAPCGPTSPFPRPSHRSNRTTKAKLMKNPACWGWVPSPASLAPTYNLVRSSPGNVRHVLSDEYSRCCRFSRGPCWEQLDAVLLRVLGVQGTPGAQRVLGLLGWRGDRVGYSSSSTAASNRILQLEEELDRALTEVAASKRIHQLEAELVRASAEKEALQPRISGVHQGARAPPCGGVKLLVAVRQCQVQGGWHRCCTHTLQAASPRLAHAFCLPGHLPLPRLCRPPEPEYHGRRVRVQPPSPSAPSKPFHPLHCGCLGTIRREGPRADASVSRDTALYTVKCEMPLS